MTEAEIESALFAMARKVKADVITTCAKVALIHINPSNSDDYNHACKDIAAKLTELGGRPIKSTEAA